MRDGNQLIGWGVAAGTYPVLFSTNFADTPAPWSLTLTVESVPSTLLLIGVESFDYPDGPIAAKNGGTVDCMAVIKGGPRITGIAAKIEVSLERPAITTSAPFCSASI